MNIEIANRLVNLRKANHLSQEELAEKLGISRQAVSKWERAEASPDTDNLILLSQIYGISLDELLKTEPDISESDIPESDVDSSGETEDYVHVGFQGVHVKDKNGEVHVGWDGIHVDDKTKGDQVHIDKNGVYVNGEKQDKEWIYHHHHFPMWAVIMVVYLVIGLVWNAWHPGWIVFLMIPVWYSLVEAVQKKDARRFAYPVLAAMVYLYLGLFESLWHPGWVVFLTIPLYYSIVTWYYERQKGGRREDKIKSSDSEKNCK